MSEITGLHMHEAFPTQPGEFAWRPKGYVESPTAIVICCPCGCGDPFRVAVHKAGAQPEVSPSWAWNGDLDKPTLSPSIDVRSGCRWHGHLVDGVFKTC